MNWRKVLKRMRPWPSRRERKAAVADAQLEAVEARHQAAHAAVLTREISRMANENHFAEAIARQIREGRRA